MIKLLRKIKVKFHGTYKIKGIDKNKYYLVVATKEVKSFRDVKGWALSECDILYYGLIVDGLLLFIDSKYCYVKLG